jgi:TetR/AcrR family transcriptional regulator, ethionamide resistance regulator
MSNAPVVPGTLSPMAVLSRRSPKSEEQRKARRAAVRARVMDATQQLLREGHTYADLGIETIAARAGISRTTFYDYFEDKRELLLALGATLIDDAIQEADEWRPGDDHDRTKTELRRIIRSLVRIYRHPVAIAIIEATFYDEAVRLAWRAEQQRHIDRAVRLLTWEREAGHFQPHGSTIEARARALHWSIHGTALHEVALKQDVDEEDIIDALVDVNILGVRGVVPDTTPD